MEHFTKQQRDRLGLLTALLMIAFTLGFILNPLLRNYSDNTGILRIGVFSDSPWGESNGYSHVILNQAIAAFEKKNPGVKVVYESGIRRQDYSEWLSEGILKGAAMKYDLDKSQTSGLVSAYTQNVTMQKDYYFAVCKYNVEFAQLIAKMGMSLNDFHTIYMNQ